jgi:hypothetical protein
MKAKQDVPNLRFSGYIERERVISSHSKVFSQNLETQL